MVEFFREHWVLTIVGAYALGQITTILVLGGLLPRGSEAPDPALQERERASRGTSAHRLGPHRPRRISGPHTRPFTRISSSIPLRQVGAATAAELN